jgi:phosphatidylglycerophosphatase A
MAVKESSDELNPPVITAKSAVAKPRPARSAKDYIALSVATCGVGYLPLAPGTWGSLVGVGVYLVFEFVSTRVLPFPPLTARNIETFDTIEVLIANTLHTMALRTTVLLFVVTLLIWAGIWAATKAEKLLGRKDPAVVVIDEVAGQLLAFLFIPLPAKLWMIVTGFLLFRTFDILKPYPARRLESLKSGLGIMADDVVAGAYAAILVAVMIAISWSI